MRPSESIGEPTIKIEMTPAQATEFVERLATDEEFRERYRNETRDLLAEYGVDVPDEMIPDDVEPPDPESLQSALLALREGRTFEVSPQMGMSAAVVTYQCFMFMRRNPNPGGV